MLLVSSSSSGYSSAIATADAIWSIYSQQLLRLLRLLRLLQNSALNFNFNSRSLAFCKGYSWRIIKLNLKNKWMTHFLSLKLFDLICCVITLSEFDRYNQYLNDKNLFITRLQSS
jgi:hypothetical protein